MRKGILDTISFFIFLSMLQSGLATAQGNDSLKVPSEFSMGFFDLNLGADLRNFKGAHVENPTASFINKAYFLTARMQSSFLHNYIFSNRLKRIRFGDVLAAELSPGIILEKPDKNFIPGIAYRFEFGFGTIISINNKNDVGLTLTLLKFARDKVSPNISGSNILLRYRYGRLMAEGGIETRRDRIFGWLNYFNINNHLPVQYTFTTRCLLGSGKNIGFRFEYMLAKSGSETVPNYMYENVIFKELWSLKLFYGIYF
jgi:hypothetical protein